MRTFRIPALTDAHVHLRQDALTPLIARHTGRVCAHVVAMPNTTPPIHSAESIKWYHTYYYAEVNRQTDAMGIGTYGDACQVHMTAKLLPETTPTDVEAAAKAGVVGFKLYPAGVTTNSHDGIPEDWLNSSAYDSQFADALKAIRDNDLVLLCHGEMPSAFCLDREVAFLDWFQWLASSMPKLRLTLEHMTTAKAVNVVRDLSITRGKILGTITLHHLLITLDDVIGDKVRPDLFCKPIAKRHDDRLELLAAAFNPTVDCFALGSDSAPHVRSAKYCAEGCAGVYTAPILLESLVEIFDNYTALERLPAFGFENANRFYGFEAPKQIVELTDTDWVVPASTDMAEPTTFRAGQQIGWQIVDRRNGTLPR